MENTNEKEWMPSNQDPTDREREMRDTSGDESRNTSGDREESLEKEEVEEESADWGDVDPQHDPLQPQGPMDPSGPGSAV
ncbi:hypothetical protein [Flavobacterium selenitireducens]|uniref:hypothetical protein n=1 Tax=Flavobacterium selenitireducens TaxID=2722704 RepID=UPI00168AD212|nr:hypothetical protein [Flavobacterium selenitireducens]MBD3582651.1 hypothetical protein [Flavobacterium selenitireducens]